MPKPNRKIRQEFVKRNPNFGDLLFWTSDQIDVIETPQDLQQFEDETLKLKPVEK